MHGNSLYLMLAQGVMTGFGYLFWVFNAHLYDSHAVGLAGTLISISTLISQISILGLNQALVRYLPKAQNKNNTINTCLWLTAVTSLVAAGIYTAGMGIFSHDLLFVREQPLLLTLFLVSMVLTTVNTFTDSVFLANRATKYNVIIYTAYSVVRLLLPFAFVSMGAIGIFSAHIAGVAVAVTFSIYYMIKKFDYRPALAIDRGIIRALGKYSLANYIAGFLWGVPLLIAPLLIVNHLGPSSAAYFYMVMMIINILLIIPTSITQALFAEGSHKENEQLRHITAKSLRLSLSLETAAVIGACLFGGLVIGIFGKEYVTGGINLLYVLAVSSLLVVLNMTGNVILKLKKRNGVLIAVNAFGAAVTAGLFLLFMGQGLIGIGYGYLAGQAVQLAAFAIVLGPTLLRHRQEQRSQDNATA
jgi:O-antigen/teichoic acid export membrane protein